MCIPVSCGTRVLWESSARRTPSRAVFVRDGLWSVRASGGAKSPSTRHLLEACVAWPGARIFWRVASNISVKRSGLWLVGCQLPRFCAFPTRGSLACAFSCPYIHPRGRPIDPAQSSIRPTIRGRPSPTQPSIPSTIHGRPLPHPHPFTQPPQSRIGCYGQVFAHRADWIEILVHSVSGLDANGSKRR